MTDIISRLEDLYKQATVERSHYYVGVTVKEAIKRIEELEAENKELNVATSNAIGALAAERDRWIREIPKHIRQKEATEAIIAAIRGEDG